MKNKEEHSNNITIFYLLILVGIISSIGLPNSLFMSLIIISNIATALVISMNEDKGSMLSKILMYTLYSVTLLFNVWCIYQTLSFYSIHLSEIMIATITLGIYYLITLTIINSEKAVGLFNKIKAKILRKPGAPEPRSEFDILEPLEIKRIIGYKSRNKEDFAISDSKSTFKATSVGESIIITPNEDMLSSIKQDPTQQVNVYLVLPTKAYTFQTQIENIDPLTLKFPEILFFDEEFENARGSYRINEPKKIKASIHADNKNYSVSIIDVSTSGIKIHSEEDGLVSYMDSDPTDLKIMMYIDGEMSTIKSEIINKNKDEDISSYGLKFLNLSDNMEKKIQLAVFEEIT